MTKILLTVNAGSSSLKLSAFLLKDGTGAPQRILTACIRGIRTASTSIFYSRYGETINNNHAIKAVQDPCDAFSAAFTVLLQDPNLCEIKSKDDIDFVCHRIVHGGRLSNPRVIDEQTLQVLAQAGHLAPLHTSGALSIVSQCKQQLIHAINIACFDTQFHRPIPAHIYTYAIDQKMATERGLRKYGFHGLSYAFLTRSVASFLRIDQESMNLIALHLGSGASACAILNGKSLDTSMGLTPLSGLPGATRSGTIDPSIVFHSACPTSNNSPSTNDTIHWSNAEHMLNDRSGWLSLTGTTDFAAIVASSHPNCKLAFDLFVHRICDFIGSYYVALQGRVDALVFAGGIGENCSELRAAVVRNLLCLGFVVDERRNESNANINTATIRDISADNQKRRVLICQTDEEMEMSQICASMKLY
ncbi:hypothetical protein VHEMI05871 [[Torrubiella] hemipterigena]|uniref:Probable acetate kinase n=1 Tax=[Torrubiella] hemipterigena TaxID=1531966 RepID=A0A0A1TI16_9HYPO|nr:hypothetical protein VHEMI05871 [[Torrubiella] hemipterigena]